MAGTFHIGATLAALLYLFMSGRWILFVPTLAYVGYLLHDTFRSKKVKGSEHWNAIIVGSGVSGLNVGIKLKELGIPFVIIEKSDELGGTWWDNQYPGAACDVPSHLYSFSFFLNPWWSRAYSHQEEIRKYLQNVADRYGLLSYIRFGRRVQTAKWNEGTQMWNVTCTSGETFKANFFFSCVGALHIPNDTRFKDDDLYAGPTFHTAVWRKDVDMKGKKVAVIGTGASAVQVVPSIANDVKELHVFQRTAAWVPPRLDFVYPQWIKTLFAIFPPIMMIHRWFYYWRGEVRFYLMFDERRHFIANIIKKLVIKHIKATVKDEKVAEKLTPKFAMGCKRITPSDNFLQAFNLPHVHLVTDPIERLTRTGIHTNSPEEGEKDFDVDVIVLATGFSLQKSATHSFKAIGRSGTVLQEMWGDEPKAYKGVTHPDYPNMFYILGPNTGLGHNTIIYMIECQVSYALDGIKKLIQSGHKSMDCKKEPFDKYMDRIKLKMKDRVFGSGGCRAWYTNARGINWTLWPEDLTQYWLTTRSCSLNDYVLN